VRLDAPAADTVVDNESLFDVIRFRTDDLTTAPMSVCGREGGRRIRRRASWERQVRQDAPYKTGLTLAIA
jgi:hypothetical protein